MCVCVCVLVCVCVCVERNILRYIYFFIFCRSLNQFSFVIILRKKEKKKKEKKKTLRRKQNDGSTYFFRVVCLSIDSKTELSIMIKKELMKKYCMSLFNFYVNTAVFVHLNCQRCYRHDYNYCCWYSFP